MIYELENKLSSREVAEMMEMEHSKLLRKIDGINQDFNQAKIGFVKYWAEGTYRDSKGEERREFQITKRGCRNEVQAMKNFKKLTRKQKELLTSKGYEAKCYLAVKNTPDILFIYNKETGQTEEVSK